MNNKKQDKETDKEKEKEKETRNEEKTRTKQVRTKRKLPCQPKRERPKNSMKRN